MGSLTLPIHVLYCHIHEMIDYYDSYGSEV